MFEVVSGNIVENVLYQVIGGVSIEYNSVTVNAGDYFLGVSGVTTFTTSGSPGPEIVTEASTFEGSAMELENMRYEGVFPDQTSFNGSAIETETILPLILRKEK